MRELILDTETTGLDASSGHRITEIGIVETVGRVATGREFHRYLNPEREIDAGASAVTGQTWADLKDMPTFDKVVNELLEFLGNDPIVAHNAPFDIGFLNAELARLGCDMLTNDVVDTLEIARKKYPGSRHSLDALCQKFEVDNTNRELHGALLDAKLLAEVYLELTGGRQTTLMSAFEAKTTVELKSVAATGSAQRITKIIQPSKSEESNRAAWVSKLENTLWVGKKAEA